MSSDSGTGELTITGTNYYYCHCRIFLHVFLAEAKVFKLIKLRYITGICYVTKQGFTLLVCRYY